MKDNAILERSIRAKDQNTLAAILGFVALTSLVAFASMGAV